MKPTWCCLVAVFLLVPVAPGAIAHSQILSGDTASAAGATTPSISSVPPSVQVGDPFTIDGSGFTSGSVVSFLVSTAGGPLDIGPLIPTSIQSDALSVYLSASLLQGEGVAGIQVVNTDQGHTVSNTVLTLLQGAASAGAPTLAQVDGVGIASSSLDPVYAVANIETVVAPGSEVILSGQGYDTTNGVGVDLFCACAGGKVGPFFLLPSNSGLSSTSLSFTLPASGSDAPSVGPGSFQVTNLGNGYKTAAVAVAVGARVTVTNVTEQGQVVTVDGTGFSNLTVINLFNLQGNAVVNLGGLSANGSPKIPLQSVTPTSLTFALPSGAVSGAAFVQALNPPFVPFDASSGAGGAFTIN